MSRPDFALADSAITTERQARIASTVSMLQGVGLSSLDNGLDVVTTSYMSGFAAFIGENVTLYRSNEEKHLKVGAISTPIRSWLRNTGWRVLEINSPLEDVSTVTGAIKALSRFSSPSEMHTPLLGKLLSVDHYLPRKQDAKQVVLKRIREIGRYRDNWDGYGAAPLSRQTLNDAERFTLSVFVGSSLYIPNISAASDGELIFSWRNQKGVMDLGFYGDGTYSFYAKLSGGKEVFVDDESVEMPLSVEIFSLISL